MQKCGEESHVRRIYAIKHYDLQDHMLWRNHWRMQTNLSGLSDDLKNKSESVINECIGERLVVLPNWLTSAQLF